MPLWRIARNPKILLAEGDVDVATMMEMILERKGAMVDVAFAGKQAVELCKLTKYDVVILAVRLPDMDSLTIFQHLRQSGSDAPVIFLTYRGEPPTERWKLKGLELGVVEHITKPFGVEELVRGVETALLHRIVQLEIEARKLGLTLRLSDSVVSNQAQPYFYHFEDMAKLRRSITAKLDLEEVRTLCFDLGVDYDSLRGEGKAANVRELLAALMRQERLQDLAQHPFMKERGIHVAIRRNTSSTAH